MNEQRAFERMPLHAPVEIRRITGDESPIPGFLIYLSAGGLSMHSEVSLRPAESVTVSFMLPDPQGEIVLELEVLASDDSVSGGARIRGRFHRPHPEAVLRIARWTERQREALRTAVGDPANGSRREFPEYIVAIDGSQLQMPRLVEIDEISLGGAALSISSPVEPGSRVRVAVIFPGEVRPIEFDLAIIALGPSPTREHTAYCQFVNLPESVRRIIEGRTYAGGTSQDER